MRLATWLLALSALTLPARAGGIALGSAIDLSAGLDPCGFAEVGAAALPEAGYLAVWTFDRGIYGRVVPASGGGPGPVGVLVETDLQWSVADLQGPFPVAGDRFLLAWTEGTPFAPHGDGSQLRWLFLDAAGGPDGPPVTADLPSGVSRWPSILPLAGGDLLVVWGRFSPFPPGEVSFQAARLAPDGSRRGEVTAIDAAFSGRPFTGLLPAGDGGAILVWAGTDPDFPIRALHLDGDGRAAGPVRTLAPATGFDAVTFSALPFPGGGGTVFWSLFNGVFAVRLDPAGVAQGPPARVDGLDPTAQFQAILHHATAARQGGIDLAFVGWHSNATAWPGLFVRRLDAAAQPTSPPIPAAAPGPLQAASRTPNAPALAPGPDGRALLVWSERQEVPVSPPPPCLAGVRVIARRLSSEGDPDAPPPPPGDLPGLVTAELPGFRFWARVTPAASEPVAASQVLPCPAETLCLAGALPGRAEALVRVIGPRPNGFLWPMLVRFTPSRVEVWIEQTASGAVRYYELPAVAPGDDRLPGRLDRQGFAPH